MFFSSPFTFPFGGLPPDEDSNGCWIGVSTPLESHLQQPFSDPSLEKLRTRLLYTLTTNHDIVKSARVALQMAFETEIGTVLTKLMTTPIASSVVNSNVCQRRHFLAIDADMQNNAYLIQPSLDALLKLPNPVPSSYVSLLQRYLASNYARYRVCALASLLVLVVLLS